MNDTHYITKNIRSYYQKRIVFPLLFFVLLFLLSLVFPLRALIFPVSIGQNASLPALYSDRTRYVDASLSELYFTGYTKTFLGRTIGYYYYTMMEDSCVIVLLRPETSSQGNPTIDAVHTKFEIIRASTAMDKLLTSLAEDLSWSKRGISDTISVFMLSEPDALGPFTVLLYLCVIGFSFYAALSVVICLLYILSPSLSPPVRSLRHYGYPKNILYKAEKELATLPQLATEDMFITEHFFIETSGFGTAIVPIKEILWIYKYSTLHKLLWHHFSISYTLYITAKNRRYIRCPKNIKSDIDGIIDYLSEANHDILVGFSEENRKKVAEIEGELLPVRKFLGLLSKRV